MTVTSPDVSEFQRPVNWRYKGKWLIFRVCDGDYLDKNARANLAWCVAKRASGQLINFTVYVVYRPGKNASIIRTLNALGVPRDCVVMIDAENWGGQISGDHSTEINDLAAALRVRQSGRADLVWAYGNRGPDLGVWPHKPSWLGWVVASYGGSEPLVANLVGWQYTNGVYSVGTLPNSTAPFGHCDHNVLYATPGWKPAPKPTPPPVLIPDPIDSKELQMTPQEKAYFDAKFADLKSLFNDTKGRPHRLGTWLSKLAGKKVDLAP